MRDRTEIPLQRLFMVQAIDLFQEAYQSYVLHHMRAHFGEQLNLHLRSLLKREKAPIFVDFVDNQPRPDFLALIHLMTRDGGLRTDESGYVPVIFAPATTAIDGVRPALVPSFKELRLIRLRRNALNHQGTLTGEMIIDSIERIVRMVGMLPEQYQVVERRLQLQLLLARAQSSEFEYQLTHMQQQQQQLQQAQSRQELLHIQQEHLSHHAQQLQRVEQQVQTQHDDVLQAQQLLSELQQQLTQLLYEQQILVSGTAEAVVDVRRQIELRIEHIQQVLTTVQSAQGADAKMLHTIDRLQRELAAQQQITADMRIELNRVHEQVDTLRSAPLLPPARIPWRWIILICMTILLGWLWYSGWLVWGLAQVSPYLDGVWRLQHNP